MRTIPVLRKQLVDLAVRVNDGGLGAEAAEILAIVKDMHRRPAVRKSARRQRPLTDALVEAIREIAADNPDLSYMEMAAVLDVSIGRVSEVLAGKRG